MRSHYDGLTSNEASQRRSVEGPNVIISPSDITFWDILWEELREPMILLLLIVGVLYSLLGEPVGAMTIFAVVLLLVPGRAGRRSAHRSAAGKTARWNASHRIVILHQGVSRRVARLSRDRVQTRMWGHMSVTR